MTAKRLDYVHNGHLCQTMPRRFSDDLAGKREPGGYKRRYNIAGIICKGGRIILMAKIVRAEAAILSGLSNAVSKQLSPALMGARLADTVQLVGVSFVPVSLKIEMSIPRNYVITYGTLSLLVNAQRPCKNWEYV